MVTVGAGDLELGSLKMTVLRHFIFWNQAWKYLPGVPALKRPNEDDCEVETSLGYIDTFSQKTRRKFCTPDYLILITKSKARLDYMAAMSSPNGFSSDSLPPITMAGRCVLTGGVVQIPCLPALCLLIP